MTASKRAHLGRPSSRDHAALIDSASRLRCIPKQYAQYRAAPEVIERFLRFDRALLDSFVRAGVPHQKDPSGTPMFEYCDLLNIGMESGTQSTIPELARGFLLRFLEGPLSSCVEPKFWQIARRGQMSTTAPDAAFAMAAGGCSAAAAPMGADGRQTSLRPIDFDAPGVRAVGQARDLSSSDSAVRVRIDGRVDQLTGARAIDVYEQLLAELSGRTVHYLTVPERLRAEPEIAWAAGLADCVVVARRLADLLRRAGYRARARRGYLLGVLGSDHSWSEIWEDGRWKCLDVVFELIALDSKTDNSQVRGACRGSRFNRLLPCVTEYAEPLVLNGGAFAPPWALASISAKPWIPTDAAGKPTTQEAHDGDA